MLQQERAVRVEHVQHPQHGHAVHPPADSDHLCVCMHHLTYCVRTAMCSKSCRSSARFACASATLSCPPCTCHASRAVRMTCSAVLCRRRSGASRGSVARRRSDAAASTRGAWVGRRGNRSTTSASAVSAVAGSTCGRPAPGLAWPVGCTCMDVRVPCRSVCTTHRLPEYMEAEGKGGVEEDLWKLRSRGVDEVPHTPHDRQEVPIRQAFLGGARAAVGVAHEPGVEARCMCQHRVPGAGVLVRARQTWRTCLRQRRRGGRAPRAARRCAWGRGQPGCPRVGGGGLGAAWGRRGDTRAAAGLPRRALGWHRPCVPGHAGG